MQQAQTTWRAAARRQHHGGDCPALPPTTRRRGRADAPAAVRCCRGLARLSLMECFRSTAGSKSTETRLHERRSARRAGLNERQLGNIQSGRGRSGVHRNCDSRDGLRPGLGNAAFGPHLPSLGHASGAPVMFLCVRPLPLSAPSVHRIHEEAPAADLAPSMTSRCWPKPAAAGPSQVTVFYRIISNCKHLLIKINRRINSNISIVENLTT